MFYQEVELKYHQLCQGDQEAATSEDNNNQGGFQFAVCRANRSSELKGYHLFFRRDSMMKSFPLTEFLWVLEHITLTSFSHQHLMWQVRHV